MLDVNQAALELHRRVRGKIGTALKVPLKTREDLSLAYTPGVAEPCRRIVADPEAVYEYTGKGNTVAVVTDGTAVLGLGDIGPAAALPVMEGKAALFKEFGDIDAVPICLDTTDVEEIVRCVSLIAPGFGGINLEDIAAPRCFEIEKRLATALDIPVFHDDQHGTAMVVLAAAENGLRAVGKTLETVKVVISGAGAAGIAVATLLLKAGAGQVLVCDRQGILQADNPRLNAAKRGIAAVGNKDQVQGTLAEAMLGADIFVGVSSAGLVTREMVAGMAKDAIVFAMANPTPEIMPEEARAAGARIIGTGRSDYPNQINNVLVFPGFFKGALRARASQVTDAMKLAGARALAALVSAEELAAGVVIPSPLDQRVAEAVAEAVAGAAQRGTE
jgi:malate dehydrogenase (oxaloacetate-decarboxylating)